ncbi:MAG: chromosome segregation protein ScpA [Ruminococcaceae bacterium]|nr:chromosome segregation protein ScpA [Oscillospiraceae bacterium]
MQEPSYHLEAVVKSRDEREDFTGPLDLILMLLAKNKIEIRDIQISSLLDQYLAYLEKMKEMDLEIASEFVQMASHLTYIKTRMLLASDPEEVSELEVLVNALEQLQHRDMLNAVKEVAPQLHERARAGFRLHVKEPELQLGQRYEYESSPAELFRALASMLLRTGAPTGEEEPALMRAIPQPITYGIREKSEEIIRLLDQRHRMPLPELYALCKSRSELVAAFISVLELCSDGAIHVTNVDGSFTVSRGAVREK